MRAIKKRSIIIVVFLLQLIFLVSCKKQMEVEVTVGETVFTITNEEFRNNLLHQLSNWELDKEKMIDYSCLLNVQITNPNHNICIINKSELYVDGYKVKDSTMKERWINMLLEQTNSKNKLIPLFLNSESIAIRADDIDSSIILDYSNKQALIDLLFQFEELTDNQTIGYGFPSYPAYQILFDNELLYVANSYDGITSLFHKQVEYHIQADKIETVFNLIPLPKIDENSLMSLYGSKKATFQKFVSTNERVDPIIRFIINESKEKPELLLGQIFGEIIFNKNEAEEIVVVYDEGFAYQGKNYYLPKCPEKLASLFSAG